MIVPRWGGNGGERGRVVRSPDPGAEGAGWRAWEWRVSLRVDAGTESQTWMNP